jgi:hypothetical protein
MILSSAMGGFNPRQAQKNRWLLWENREFNSCSGVIFRSMKKKNSASRLLIALVASTVFLSINHASAVIDPIPTEVTATSTASGEVSVQGTPDMTSHNESLFAGPSGVLGASDSMGDSGYNTSFQSVGNFVTNLAGTDSVNFPAPTITYNLGAAYNVGDLLIWNFSQHDFQTAGAKSVTILYSTDGSVFNTYGTVQFNLVTEDPGYGTPGQIVGDDVVGAANVPAQILSVDLPDTQYVELVINSNWGYTGIGADPNTYGPNVGLGEVNFAVPEPSTFAMLALGLAGLIALQRKRASLFL